jgi:hypothetical protein
MGQHYSVVVLLFLLVKQWRWSRQHLFVGGCDEEDETAVARFTVATLALVGGVTDF